MLNKEIPFIRICIPLCLGIITGLKVTPGEQYFILAAIIILIFFVASLFCNKGLTNHLFGVAFQSALFTCGLFLYTKEKEKISFIENEENIISGVISDYPEEKNKSYRILLELEKMITKKEETNINGSLIIYYRKDSLPPVLSPGDRILFRCKPVEITSRGNPDEFDYRFYMETRGIRYISFIDESDIIRHLPGDAASIRHRALRVREQIIEMYRERNISNENLALVAAITLGRKNMLDPEQKEYFMRAGIMHVMAVSGLHALILSMFVFRMLFFLKGRMNILRVIITILILWTFAFITGLSSSVMRASLMFTFLHAGRIMRRPVNGINSVLASALVLILIRPSVIFDAGFQLSYSAVIFIISFYRELYQKITIKKRLPDLIWQSVAVTIIAQAATFPLTIMLFNRFPVCFIVSNIIIVPLASLIIILGAMVLITYPVHFLSVTLAKMLDITTGSTHTLTEMISSLPFSTIEKIGFTTPGCIILTVTIFLSLRYLLNRKSISVLLPLAGLFFFVAEGTVREISYKRTNELIVYNSTISPLIGIRTGNILHVYSDTCLTQKEIVRQISVHNFSLKENIIKGETVQFSAAGRKIMISSRLNSSVLAGNYPDIIILTGKKPYIDKDIKPGRILDALVISPEAVWTPWNIENLEARRIHFVNKQGAFHLIL